MHSTERQEVRPIPPKQQILKATPSVSGKTGDLAVEHRARRPNVRDLFCEIGPTLEPMTVTRDELAVVAGDVRQRAYAVELHLVP